MFNSKHILMAKIVLVVTFIVSLAACSNQRVKLGEDEKRIIPQSDFGSSESWHEEYEPPNEYASSKESFRARVKKSGIKSRKSTVASGR